MMSKGEIMSDGILAADRNEPLHAREIAWLTPVFLLSGAAALIYQVAWERVLYSIFGVNSEAITVLVTAFLLGLGIGSLTGGWISKRPGCSHLSWFAAAELCVGAFGAISIPFYHAVGNATLGMSRTSTAFVTFLLVLAPTLLMGATLPLLVTYAVRITKSVGWSVGMLYHVNTAGSALAAILAVTLLLPYAGLQRSVWFAVCCNFVVAIAALRHQKHERRGEAEGPDALVSVQQT
jgi:spermidine synthase